MDSKGGESLQIEFRETDGGKQRFLLELEFVQLLANPAYINHLAQNRYFENPAFVKYLQYLQYWKRPEYAKFVVFPHCFHFLDLLQDEHFRKAVASTQNKELLHTQQFYFWKYYRTNKLQKLLESKPNDGPDEKGDSPDKKGEGTFNVSQDKEQHERAAVTRDQGDENGFTKKRKQPD